MRDDKGVTQLLVFLRYRCDLLVLKKKKINMFSNVAWDTFSLSVQFVVCILRQTLFEVVDVGVSKKRKGYFQGGL